MPRPTPQEDFRRNLKEARLAREMSQDHLAELTGCSRPYISELERGEHESPSLTILARLAKALKVPVWVIIMPKKDFRSQFS